MGECGSIGGARHEHGQHEHRHLPENLLPFRIGFGHIDLFEHDEDHDVSGHLAFTAGGLDQLAALLSGADSVQGAGAQPHGVGRDTISACSAVGSPFPSFLSDHYDAVRPVEGATTLFGAGATDFAASAGNATLHGGHYRETDSAADVQLAGHAKLPVDLINSLPDGAQMISSEKGLRGHAVWNLNDGTQIAITDAAWSKPHSGEHSS